MTRLHTVFYAGLLFLMGTAASSCCESEHCHDWSSSDTKTCRADIKLQNVEVTAKAYFRIVGPEEVMNRPPEFWNPLLDNLRPANNGSLAEKMQDFGLSCHSDLFDDLNVTNYSIMEMAKATCQLKFGDNQQTQYVLRMNSTERVATALIQTSSQAPETIELQTDYSRDPYFFPPLPVRRYVSPERKLVFADFPLQLRHVRIMRDGENATSESGKRYSTSCHVSNVPDVPGQASGSEKSGRDPALLEEPCIVSGHRVLGDKQIVITPKEQGILVSLRDAAGQVLQETSAEACEDVHTGR